VQEQSSSGLTPEEALRKWSDPTAVREMDGLSSYSGTVYIWTAEGPRGEYEIGHDRWWKVRAPLEKELLSKLRAEVLTATALQTPIGLTSERTRVPARFWDFLEVNFQTGSAEGNGLKVIELEISHSGAVVEQSAFPTNISPKPPVIAGGRTATTELQLSDDDAVLILFGEKLIFRGVIQRSLLRQLVDAHGGDRRLRTDTLLRKAGTQVDSIAKVFRKNEHWPKLKKIIRQKQGLTWIDLSAPP